MVFHSTLFIQLTQNLISVAFAGQVGWCVCCLRYNRHRRPRRRRWASGGGPSRYYTHVWTLPRELFLCLKLIFLAKKDG